MSLSDLKKSVESVFSERISSPFYGTFLLSWAIWNWQIIYLTIFVDQELLEPKTKLEYILEHYSNWWVLFVFPLLSTAFLIGVVPWVVNKALKIHLHYERERIEMRESIDKGRRLTIEQTAEIRNKMNEWAVEHENQLQRKDDELKICKQQISQLETDKVAFKVNKAVYGNENSWNDVTETVNKLLLEAKGQEIVVSNEILGGDPISGIPKLLVISYKWNNVTETVIAKEHYRVFLKDSYISLEETEEAKQFYEEIRKREKQHNFYLDAPNLIQSFFPGTWKLQYKGKLNGEELVQIRDGNKYYAELISSKEFIHYFDLLDVEISIYEQVIKFSKVGTSHNNRKTTSTLNIIEMGKIYKGIEEEAGVTVEYVRID